MQVKTSARVRFFVSVGTALAALGSASSRVNAQALFVFHPVADSYVDSALPSNNFGLSPYLEVSGGNLPGSDFRHSFLKFDLSGYTGPVGTVSLVLYGQHVATSTANSSEPDTAWGVPSNDWTTLGLTWNNQPALGPAQSTITVNSTLGSYFWDVTPFVKSRLLTSTSRVVSLAVTEALVPGGSQGYDIFGAGPRPFGPVISWPAPELLISP